GAAAAAPLKFVGPAPIFRSAGAFLHDLGVRIRHTGQSPQSAALTLTRRRFVMILINPPPRDCRNSMRRPAPFADQGEPRRPSNRTVRVSTRRSDPAKCN